MFTDFARAGCWGTDKVEPFKLLLDEPRATGLAFSAADAATVAIVVFSAMK